MNRVGGSWFFAVTVALAACANGGALDSGGLGAGSTTKPTGSATTSGTAGGSTTGNGGAPGTTTGGNGAATTTGSGASKTTSTAATTTGSGAATTTSSAATTTTGSSGTAGCSPASCPNGCCNNGACLPGTSATECGNHGEDCVSCAASSEACTTYVCVAPPQCNAGNCPSSCCQGGVCQPFGMTDDDACGKGGVACMDCTTQGGSTFCNNGFCTQ